jgi:hypothetical protein
MISRPRRALWAGHARPVVFRHVPPGAVGNWAVLPLAALMLAWSLWSARRDVARPAAG